MALPKFFGSFSAALRSAAIAIKHGATPFGRVRYGMQALAIRAKSEMNVCNHVANQRVSGSV
jgi:hypothetical protein